MCPVTDAYHGRSKTHHSTLLPGVGPGMQSTWADIDTQYGSAQTCIFVSQATKQSQNARNSAAC